MKSGFVKSLLHDKLKAACFGGAFGQDARDKGGTGTHLLSPLKKSSLRGKGVFLYL
jgi:hypothetical protein